MHNCNTIFVVSKATVEPKFQGYYLKSSPRSSMYIMSNLSRQIEHVASFCAYGP